MRIVRLSSGTDFEAWRAEARSLLAGGIAPDEVTWARTEDDGSLFDLLGNEATGRPTSTGSGVSARMPGKLPDSSAPEGASTLRVPRTFIDLARQAILHRDPERFALLYRLLWRLRDEPGLMEITVDPLVAHLSGLVKAVRRDIHKMHAFVRFRSVQSEAGEHFIAWFEPDHYIVEAAAPFFQRRFAAMRWSILTPDRSAHWDGADLRFGPGAAASEAPDGDRLEALWRRYYASIFNPARLKVAMMRSEMPEKYWKNLPEASLIKPLIDDASRRSASMLAAPAPEPNRRPQRSRAMDSGSTDGRKVELEQGSSPLERLRREAAICRACPLWEPATQTVFGEGPEAADLVFVGEQPGDSEDLAGKPFIGPAGQLLDRALKEAGVDRGRAYVTNAVKHFKFEPRGKRRIHQKPNTGEIRACRPWLMREIEILSPKLVVALGATAVQSVAGKALPITANRGRLLTLEGGLPLFVTVHPSYLLRLPDESAKALEYQRFVADLRMVGTLMTSPELVV